jgi:peroxiredoxin
VFAGRGETHRLDLVHQPVGHDLEDVRAGRSTGWKGMFPLFPDLDPSVCITSQERSSHRVRTWDRPMDRPVTGSAPP